MFGVQWRKQVQWSQQWSKHTGMRWLRKAVTWRRLSSQSLKFQHVTVTKHRVPTIQVPATCFENGFRKKKGSVNLNLDSAMGSVNSFCCYKPEELSSSFWVFLLSLLWSKILYRVISGDQYNVFVMNSSCSVNLKLCQVSLDTFSTDKIYQ